MDKILTSIKKLLGIEEEYTHFDADLIMYINSAFLDLNQIGVGPDIPFVLKDANDVWNDFFGDRTDLESVKTYVYLKIRLLFDPPSNSFVLDSMEKLIAQHEWRLLHQTQVGGVNNV